MFLQWQGCLRQAANGFETVTLYGGGMKPVPQPNPLPTDLGCTREFSERAEVTLMCEARQGLGAWQSVRLHDISQAGFRLQWNPRARRDTPLRVRIPGLQLLTAHIRWQQAETIGCEFAERLHVAVFEHIVRQAGASGF